MLIEFVPNPDFTPQPPPIRVGSVVSFGNGHKGVVTKLQTSLAASVRIHPDYVDYYERSTLTPLPLRVSGISESGEWEYAPLDPPPPPFSWDDYPPKAGMVVEWGHCRCVLLGTAISLESFNGDGVRMGQGGPLHFQNNYRPRPDLMPRFVTEGRR